MQQPRHQTVMLTRNSFVDVGGNTRDDYEAFARTLLARKAEAGEWPRPPVMGLGALARAV